MADEPVTRVTLFVPGSAELKRSGIDGEWIDNPKDGSFAESFAFGTVEDDGLEAIEATPGALLVQLTDDLGEGRKRVLKVVEKLKQHGAVAVRLEQSKLGWEIGKWLELVGGDIPNQLHLATVTMLTNNDHVVSCGMHAFSLPDARLALAGVSAEDAQQFLSTLNLYQIVEDPLLLSGQTFAPDPETPRRVLQRWPDDGYPPAHWCHNPYGVWHLGPAGGKGEPQSELHPQFIPALRVLLASLEEKNGAPLTREQVEKIRDGAPCLAMKHRDAQKMERSRGYADIDPRLAYEQWCVVRENRDDDD